MTQNNQRCQKVFYSFFDPDTQVISRLCSGSTFYRIVSYDVNMFYRSYHVDIVDTQKKYLRMRKSAEEKQDDKIVAPMPGKVVKIPVRKGDRLETGDTVVVLEAMKMQSNYKVSSACVVKDILVSEGDSVDNNQVLMTLALLKDDSYE